MLGVFSKLSKKIGKNIKALLGISYGSRLMLGPKTLSGSGSMATFVASLFRDGGWWIISGSIDGSVTAIQRSIKALVGLLSNSRRGFVRKLKSLLGMLGVGSFVKPTLKVVSFTVKAGLKAAHKFINSYVIIGATSLYFKVSKKTLNVVDHAYNLIFRNRPLLDYNNV
jgi:hypothetical protein